MLNAWKALIHPDDVSPILDAFTEFLDGKRKTLRREVRMKAKSGEWRWFLCQVKAPQKDESRDSRRGLMQGRAVEWDRKDMLLAAGQLRFGKPPRR